ncbi:hypothetical protein SLEP1_g10593 [Rubroshorea leprosula]|uniref:Uncharacterized protein n=1 Tax=Rubroshorea leprosula TaxID=152421 RepID=A0AAV5IJG7_9ROSI|nr:hypothetical protein SLEP1_g10593 [Rubroshorea leprosula]
MAVALRRTRGGGSASLCRFFSYRILVSALFSLLFHATLSALFTSRPPTFLHDSSLPTPCNAYVHGTFLALNSDPLKTRLGLIYRQATDHLTLVNSMCIQRMQGS